MERQRNGGDHNSNPLTLSGQKRHPNYADYGYVKLYVTGTPRTATVHEVELFFGMYGDIIEVAFLRDKFNGDQLDACFVKYANVDQAEDAIGALQGHPFAEGTPPLQLKYAVGERERLGNCGTHFHKLYVGSLNKQAGKWEVEDIFSPFGVVEEVYLVRDEMRQNRGSAFVQFSCREMAIAAIHALNGIFKMEGCEQPLIVRFADPKRPRVGDFRQHAPYFNDRPSGGHATFSYEMRHTMKSSPLGFSRPMRSAHAAPAAHHHQVNSLIAEDEYPIDCEWSEHVDPDGDLYYYNCVTCESRWEKPEEYARYEQELDNMESEPDARSSPEAFEASDV